MLPDDTTRDGRLTRTCCFLVSVCAIAVCVDCAGFSGVPKEEEGPQPRALVPLDYTGSARFLPVLASLMYAVWCDVV